MRNSFFIRIFFVAFTVIILLVGAGNYIVDPYGFHFNNRYEGFNKHKPSFLNYTRLIKLYNADIIDPEAIFLGNSRILYLAPEKAFAKYKPYRYYNFSLSSGNAYEMNELLAYSIRNYNLKFVCYGIDYIAMNNWGPKYGTGFNVELVQGKKSKLLEYIKLHTSMQAISESYACITSNKQDPEGLNVKYHFNEQGSRSNRWRELNLQLYGDTWIDQEIQSTLTTYDQLYNSQNPYIPEYKKEAYRSVVEQCKQHGIEYMAYINPLYEDQFKLLISSSSYNSYIDLLRFLAINGGFWYFGGINKITSDKSLYWDSQHPRKELSFLLAELMFTENDLDCRSEQFGRFYDESNVDLLIESLGDLRKRLIKEE